MKVENFAARTIDYRLNILGIRAWEHSCQLIAKAGDEWSTIGPRWDLPVHIPKVFGAALENAVVPVAAAVKAPTRRSSPSEE